MATMVHIETERIENPKIPLDRDAFMRSLIRELAGTLEDVVGLKDASGFVSVVGQSIGEQLNAQYRAALKLDSLTRNQVRDVMVNLNAVSMATSLSSRKMGRRSSWKTAPVLSATRWWAGNRCA